MGGKRASRDTVWRAGDDGDANYSESPGKPLEHLLQAHSKLSTNILFIVLLGIIWGGSATGKEFIEDLHLYLLRNKKNYIGIKRIL